MTRRSRPYDLFPVLLPLFLLFTMNLAADTLYVGEKQQIRKIGDAISRAKSGDVIVVHQGFYPEANLVIDKMITLTGIGFPVVDGNNTGEVFTVRADSVRISGFQVQNCGISYVKDLAGISVEKFSHCVIENNRLVNTFFGIYLKNASHCTVRNNTVTGQARDEFSSGNAIHLWYSKNILVEGNTCRGHRDGIYLEFVENSRMIRNVAEDNLRYGLHFMFSNHDEYLENEFRRNGAGVAVMFSRHITMFDNLFEKNWGSNSYGLLLKDITDGEIGRNRFVENTIGIYGDGANRIRMEHNEFSGNGWALKLLGSCSDNVITANNFLDNTFDVITNTPVNRNTYHANYWSDYTGYDLDRDGTGDVPYKPVRLFSFVTSQVPQAIILLRSPFVDLVNFAEKVMPSITPATLEDVAPLMKRISWP